MFKQAAAFFLALLIVSGATIVGMVKGWGLQPVSYFWILGSQVLIPVFVRLLLDIAIEDKACAAASEDAAE